MDAATLYSGAEIRPTKLSDAARRIVRLTATDLTSAPPANIPYIDQPAQESDTRRAQCFYFYFLFFCSALLFANIVRHRKRPEAVRQPAPAGISTFVFFFIFQINISAFCFFKSSDAAGLHVPSACVKSRHQDTPPAGSVPHRVARIRHSIDPDEDAAPKSARSSVRGDLFLASRLCATGNRCAPTESLVAARAALVINTRDLHWTRA